MAVDRRTTAATTTTTTTGGMGLLDRLVIGLVNVNERNLLLIDK